MSFQIDTVMIVLHARGKALSINYFLCHILLVTGGAPLSSQALCCFWVMSSRRVCLIYLLFCAAAYHHSPGIALSQGPGWTANHCGAHVSGEDDASQIHTSTNFVKEHDFFQCVETTCTSCQCSNDCCIFLAALQTKHSQCGVWVCAADHEHHHAASVPSSTVSFFFLRTH